MNADKKIDCFGLLCPMPVVQTARAIAKMSKGQTLEVVGDDVGMKTDLPAWCEATGHKLLGVEQEGNIIHVFVKKR